MLNPSQFAAYDRHDPLFSASLGQTDAYPTKRGFRGKFKSNRNSAWKRTVESAPLDPHLSHKTGRYINDTPAELN